MNTGTELLPPRSRKPAWKTFLRLALPIVIVAYIFQRVGPHEVLVQIENIHYGWMSLAIASLLAGCCARIWSWQHLVARFGTPGLTTLPRMARCYFMGGLFGTALPARAGTEAVRCLLAAKTFGGAPSRYVAAAVAMSGLILVASAAMGLVAVGLLGSGFWRLPLLQVGTLLFVAMLIGIPLAYLLLHYNRQLLVGLLRAWPRWGLKVRRPARRFIHALRIFEQPGNKLGGLLCSALIANTATTSAYVAAARSIGVDLELLTWLAVVPLVAVGTFIPASVSGFGADQAVMIYLLAPFGVSAADAFAVSALIGLGWIFIYCAVGVIAFAAGLLTQRRKAQIRTLER